MGRKRRTNRALSHGWRGAGPGEGLACRRIAGGSRRRKWPPRIPPGMALVSLGLGASARSLDRLACGFDVVVGGTTRWRSGPRDEGIACTLGCTRGSWFAGGGNTASPATVFWAGWSTHEVSTSGCCQTIKAMRRRTSASVRGDYSAQGCGLGTRRLCSPSKRGIDVFVHRQAARQLVVYAVDRYRQFSRQGRNRTQGSTHHRTSSYRLGVGAEGEIPMQLTPAASLCHSHRPVHPHETVREVAARPPRREALQVEDRERCCCGTGPAIPGG